MIVNRRHCRFSVFTRVTEQWETKWADCDKTGWSLLCEFGDDFTMLYKSGLFLLQDYNVVA